MAKDNSLTTILRKFYCPLYTQIMDELLIMTDYKQCSNLAFFLYYMSEIKLYQACYVDIISRLVSDDHVWRIFADNQVT